MAQDDFERLRGTLAQELEAILAANAGDEDDYGFALQVPSDCGSAGLVYTLGRESNLTGRRKKSIDYRYSPVEWAPNWLNLPQSNDILEVAAQKCRTEIDKLDDDAKSDELHELFIAGCASSCLQVLQECERRGLFGTIWYKVLDMSDEEHSVVSEAFRTLNSGRALEEAAPLFDY